MSAENPKLGSRDLELLERLYLGADFYDEAYDALVEMKYAHISRNFTHNHVHITGEGIEFLDQHWKARKVV